MRVGWTLQGPSGFFYRYRGRCLETMKCPVVYLARIFFMGEALVQVRQFYVHDHADLQAGHGAVFNAAQEKVARRYAELQVEKLTLRGLDEALRVARLEEEAWPSKASRQSWVYRQNQHKRKERGVPASTQVTASPVVLQEACFASLKVKDCRDVFLSSDNAALWVLPTAIINPARSDGCGGSGYVPFTCRGMSDAVKKVPPGDILAVGVDAKVGQGVRAWRTASIGIFVKGDLRKSTLKRTGNKAVQGLVYTTSFPPLLEARMHEEINDNYCQFFKDSLGFELKHFLSRSCGTDNPDRQGFQSRHRARTQSVFAKCPTHWGFSSSLCQYWSAIS